MTQLGTPNKDDYVFFWSGIYSQWHPSSFIFGSIEFTCCEQYMMYCKALLFNDEISAAKIMASTSPAIQKAVGRKVAGFDKDIWDAHCDEIVYVGNLAKFKQHDYMSEQLLATDKKIIVEASPSDPIWGIGYHESTAMENIGSWGQNRLGKALMRVRDTLQNGQTA